MRAMYRNTEQDNIPLNEERPWSSKDRIGLSEEGEKRKKFSSETHYWWAKYLNSGLRFLVTLVLILALAFFTCGVFIVFCRKCDDKVCTTIKFLTRASKISLPQTKKNSTPPDKGKYHSPRQRKISFPQTKENITLPDKGKYHSPRQRKISLSQTKENISPPDKGKYLSPRQRKISLPQTKENNTAPDKENITSQNKENISLPDKGKYHSPRQRKISLPQTKENISPPDKGKYHSPRQRKI